MDTGCYKTDWNWKVCFHWKVEKTGDYDFLLSMNERLGRSRLAWQPPHCVWHLLLPLKLNLIRGLTSQLDLGSVSSQQISVVTWTEPGWPRLPSMGLPCLPRSGRVRWTWAGEAIVFSAVLSHMAPCPPGSSWPSPFPGTIILLWVLPV